MKKIFLLLSLTCLSYVGRAQGGSCDYSFAPPSATSGTVNAIALHEEGKIIIAGDFTKYGAINVGKIARVMSDNAALDVTFSTGTGADNTIFACVAMSDGKILIGGMFNSFNGTARRKIARLNANGSLDATFDPGDGLDSWLVKTIAVQPDGKILIGGYFASYDGTARNNIARLNADGSLDMTFDPGTGTDDYIGSIVCLSDGKILISGMFHHYNGTARNAIARLNADGGLDTSFDPGTGANEAIATMTLQTDQKILIGGDFTSYNGETRNRIARLEQDGSLDASFDPGLGADAYVLSIAVQSNNKIVLTGLFTNFAGAVMKRIARLNADGSREPSFNPGIGADAGINVGVLQEDGKILIGGLFTNYDGNLRKLLARVHNGCGLRYKINQVSICEGDSYVFNNHTYTEPNAYLDTLQTVWGCDSVVITILNVNAAVTYNRSKTICKGDSYQVGTHTYTVTGNYRDTLQSNLSGCDSIIVTTLTVIPTSTTNNQTVCQGKSISVVFSTYNTSGTYIDVIENLSGSGCDLTITTNLTVTPAPVHNNYTTICSGGSYVYNGHTYSATGIYRDTIQNGVGCDSIVITNLTVYPKPDVSVTQQGNLLSALTSGATYQWLNCEDDYSPIVSATNQSFTAMLNGSYALEITENNCVDTSDCYSVVITGVEKKLRNGSISFSPNPVQDYVELSVSPFINLQSVKVMNAQGQLVLEQLSKRFEVAMLPSGVYHLLVETDQGSWRETFVKK